MNVAAHLQQSVHTVAQVEPTYMTGFGKGFETESLPGALPIGRNSPQKCPYGLYAERIFAGGVVLE